MASSSLTILVSPPPPSSATTHSRLLGSSNIKGPSFSMLAFKVICSHGPMITQCFSLLFSLLQILLPKKCNVISCQMQNQVKISQQKLSIHCMFVYACPAILWLCIPSLVLPRTLCMKQYEHIIIIKCIHVYFVHSIPNFVVFPAFHKRQQLPR